MADATTTDGPAAFEAITTQEAADAYVQAHLPSDYEAALARASELEASYAQSQESLAQAQRALAAAEVAAATGVPASALTGATKKEMEASAAALLEWRSSSAPKPPAAPAPLSRPGVRSGASGAQEPLSPKAAAAAALRRMRGAQ